MLYCIAPPNLRQDDEDRISRIRRLHDPLASRIGPHVTLVFGVTGLSVETFRAHVGAVAERATRFSLRFIRAAAVGSHTGPETHVFLLPDNGAPVEALHAALYTGPLASAPRHDIPFIPHMTVGAFQRAEGAAALSDEINDAGLDVPADMDRLAVVAARGATFETLAEFAL